MNSGVGETIRLRITVRGAVQGVGFRPWVYRLAKGMNLSGWVRNSSKGVTIEVEGAQNLTDDFLASLGTDIPPLAAIHAVEFATLLPAGYAGFSIAESDSAESGIPVIVPDIAPCPECLTEMNDPSNRRYGYPFINCTNCGPRYSIITDMPYDRPATTMAEFTMCPDCRREYEDPADRRFHAQPIACHTCGPRLSFTHAGPNRESISGPGALELAVDAIRGGQIVALKAVGGFQLLADARNAHVIHRLRRMKARDDKPFALMYPNVEMVRHDCLVSDAEERLLSSPEAPIVILDRESGSGDMEGSLPTGVDSSVAPHNPTLGVMLPSSPLHHLLMAKIGIPIVATSGNAAEEPICTENDEALVRLGKMADCFLMHNRPIARHVDDSIVRVMAGREMILRRARGYAPLNIAVPPRLEEAIPPAVAVGAHLKNTIAVGGGTAIAVSQHIGDLESPEAYNAFEKAIEDLTALYKIRPNVIIADIHPDYLSTRYAVDRAARSGGALRIASVQHHYAHIAAVMAENGLEGDVLGVAWDGTGLGNDGTIWGGEFLLAGNQSYRRIGSLRRFTLPGGDRAVTEPRRTALGLLHEMYGSALFSRNELVPVSICTPWEHIVFGKMLRNRFNAPVTSSAGRLFDAVASITNIRQRVTFEGQAAMQLEFAIDRSGEHGSYPFSFTHSPEAGCDFVVDWEPMIRAIITEHRNTVRAGIIAARFHNTLSEIIVRASISSGCRRVALGGGCFQNRYLLERTVRRLKEEGLVPYWPRRIPPNDGGIAFGQLHAYVRGLRGESHLTAEVAPAEHGES